MHLLMSGMSASKGGKETYIVGMTRELIKLGDTVDFLTVDNPMAYEDEMASLGCCIYHIPKRNEHPIGHRKAIAQVLSSGQFDVVWSHKTSLSSIDDLEIAKNAGVSTRIVHSHCTENMGGRFTAIMHAVNRKRVGRIATHYFACSQRAGKYFFPPNIGFEVVNNAFDVDKFAFSNEARKAVRYKLAISESTFVLCHVGRFSQEKNHSKILNVFANIHAKNFDTVLLLCGDGPTRKQTEDLAAALGITNSVLFLGVVDNIPSILSASDVLIFPSIHEGLPYALLEAQANGLPCVVSDTIDRDGFQKGIVNSLDITISDEVWAEQCLDIVKKRRTTPCASFNSRYDLAEEAVRIRKYLL